MTPVAPPRAGTGLDPMSSHQFNDQRMKAMLPRDVWERFRDARALGEDVSEDDMDVIAVRSRSPPPHPPG